MEVDVERLHERLVRTSALLRYFLLPFLHDHSLKLRGTGIADPPATVSGNPIQRLTAVASDEDWNLSRSGFRNQVGAG